MALASALVWGSGDFAGGCAARRVDAFQVLALSALSGIALLLGCAVAWRVPWPPGESVAWAAIAGVSGAVGIASLYRGLSLGSAAVVAPTAAVITAAFPVVWSAATTGLPRPTQGIGFLVAILGIWLVARSGAASAVSITALRLAVLAGIGFGGFLILVARVRADVVFLPLVVTRTVTLATALGVLWKQGTPWPAVRASPVALVAGALDAGGNVLFLLARQETRLDVASVLSSFYPIATVTLARIILGEPVAGVQWMGAAVCLVAVALITI